MISLRNVSKKFKLFRNPSDRVWEWLHLGTRHQDFFALRDINLEVPAGRTMGIIGANGAGKSTLLKLITGTLLPTTGEIEIVGRIAALLELGTGFHSDFTGRQNIYINGQLLGLAHHEIEELEPAIIDFSELGTFIDQPLRTYSSGMVVRLGFSIAASVNPEVLIVDEALSVGDARFSQKCIRRIQEFRDRGTTILFVSHDPAAITTLCDEAVLIEGGELRSRGAPRDILNEYNALLASKGTGNTAMRVERRGEISKTGPERHGTFQALIEQLTISGEDGIPREDFNSGETVVIRVGVRFLSRALQPSVGFMIKDRLGLSLFGSNTHLKRIEFGPCEPGDWVEAEFKVPLHLGYGTYNLTIAVHEDETHLQACYEWIDNAAFFRVHHAQKPDWAGMVHLHPKIEVRRDNDPGTKLTEGLELRFGEIADPLHPAVPAPSPYLHGFSEPVPGPDGVHRILESRSLFVFTPRHAHLCLRLSGAGTATYTVTAIEHGDAHEFQRKTPRAVLSIPLPPEAVGRPSVYRLEFDSTEGNECIYLIGSTDNPQEKDDAWPITTPTRSWKTSSGSWTREKQKATG